MGSRKCKLSGGCRRDSHDSVGEDNMGKFSNGPEEDVGVRQYKGMVPQPNGRWGIQVYEKHKQVWPGTFNGEYEAAKAIVSFKLGGRDPMTKLKPQMDVGHLETRLPSVHSKGQVVDMLIDKHTYEAEPGHSKNIDRPRTRSETEGDEEKDLKGLERIYNPGGGEDDNKASLWRREHMFEKAVTPSDVGKLNRLVIPKQHAEKYFPLDTDANEKGLLLNFEDSMGKEWRFRYSYWNSSQSYVLTKGWNRFVKEKKLDAGDTVSFDRATHQDPNLQRLFISCKRKPFSAAQPPGLPVPVKRPVRLSSLFQFSSDATTHDQQLVSSRALIPQWKPLFYPANNMNGESSQSADEKRVLQPNGQPVDLLTSLHFITTNDKPRKGIHDTTFPFPIQRSSNTWDCGRHAMDTESSVRAPLLHTIQMKSRGISRDDLSRPIENKVPEASATCFDHSNSKKVVRLFGIDLECGKVDDNYEDELLIIPPSERLFPRNHHPHDQREH